MGNIKKEVRIFAEDIEPEALKQFDPAMAQKISVKGALMPEALLAADRRVQKYP